MNKSESIAKLAQALSQAQANYESLTKDAQAHNYKYAKLDQYHENIQAAFSKVGLSYIQTIETGDKAVRATTMIMHESGEWISNEFTLRCAKDDPQGNGSAITYARRYGLQSACGIPSEDDDGTAASSRPATDPKVAIAAIEKTTSVAEMTAYYNNLDPAAKRACLETCKSHKLKLTTK